MNQSVFEFIGRLAAPFVTQASPPPQPRRQASSASPQAPANNELQARARELLLAIGLRELAAQTTVRWNPRMRSTAGVADYRKHAIALNPRLVAFGDAEVDRTLRHELAHLVARHRNPRHRIEPHGAEWRRACADLGIPGESARHTLPLPRRTLARPHLYVCPTCRTELRRVRPFHRAVACLACCRTHNHGRYDVRFRLEKVRASSAL